MSAGTLDQPYDVMIVGGGTAGIPAAIEATLRGAEVILIDAAPVLGGTLNISSGQLSAAGTRLQRERGIEDSPAAHLQDILAISKGTVNLELVDLAVNLAGDTVDWLADNGLKFGADHPVRGQAHEPYSTPRYYWGERGGRAVRDVLVEMLEDPSVSEHLEVRLNTSAKELLFSEQGHVAGLLVEAGQKSEKIYAKNIVLATGGYNSNPQLYHELTGRRSYAGMSYEYNLGVGVDLASQAGGWLRGHENFLTSFGNILDREGELAPLLARVIHDPAERQPWEITVNENGLRFVAEDNPSVDAREQALLNQSNHVRFIIFDDEIFQTAPPLLLGWTREEIAEMFNKHPMFTMAPTLEELAANAGIDERGLRTTVRLYNRYLDAPDWLSRSFRPAPISTAPYYSIRVQGTSVTSTVGVAVDDSLRVIDKDGVPIEGLFAAGEILGSGMLMGRSFCGGMMATPAMSFGRFLGREVLTW